MELKHCVDSQYLHSMIALGFISDVKSYEDLSSERLREFLDNRAIQSKKSITIAGLYILVSLELIMKMANRDAEAHMEGLFVSYHSLFSNHAVVWIISDNQKLSVNHVMSSIKPKYLKERLEADLDFSHHMLKKYFNGFRKHAVELSKDFALLDAGPKKSRKDRDNENRNGKHNGNGGSGGPSRGGSNNDNCKKRRNDVPLCLWDKHMKQGIRH